MPRAGQFPRGHDARRSRAAAGRGPSASSIASVIRLTLGRDAALLCEQVQVLARAGDPQALCAAAALLAAVARGPAAAPAVEATAPPAGPPR